MSERYSLLPDNRSLLEKGLENAFSDLLYDIPSHYPALLDANKTPVSMLPYLAQERSVVGWNSDDTEQVKRQIITSAWEVRRLSGTRAGIRLSLQALDFESTITPWYQSDFEHSPYTLSVEAFHKDNHTISEADARRIISQITETKSCRDAISLSLVYRIETQFSSAAASALPVTVKATDSKASLWPMPKPKQTFGIAGAISRHSVSVTPMSVIAVVVPYDVDAQAATIGGSYSFSVLPINLRAIT